MAVSTVTIAGVRRAETASTSRDRLAGLLAEFGITRVANVTGLDRIGIPVYMAIRPNARSLSVSQGKGLTHDAAWVSGVMESIELHYAESPDLPLYLASADELAGRDRLAVDLGALPARRSVRLDPHRRLLWATAVDLATGEDVFVPYSLVHVDAVPPFPPGDELFTVTSNGLASGSTDEDATVHALCEVIERDAVHRWSLLPAEARALTWVETDGLGPDASDLIARCRDADFDVLTAIADSPTGVPVVVSVLLDRRTADDNLTGAAMGFGCHTDPDAAFCRALTEAAQSRLTLIAGSRDDLVRGDYETRRRHQTNLAGYRALVDTPKRESISGRAWPCCADDTSAIVDRLAAAGVDRAVRVTLSGHIPGISVVRVIVPGLLGPVHV